MEYSKNLKEVAVEEVVEEPKGFVSDYKYANTDSIRNVTINQLAKLEADLHSLRMVYVANGENANSLVAPNKTIGQEMALVIGAIKNLEDYFASVL
jgi:hypothetical protein